MEMLRRKPNVTKGGFWKNYNALEGLFMIDVKRAVQAPVTNNFPISGTPLIELILLY